MRGSKKGAVIPGERYDNAVSDARENLRAQYHERLLEELENVDINNPTLAEFDALMREIRDEGIDAKRIREAFKKAVKEFAATHGGQKFPFSIAEAD